MSARETYTMTDPDGVLRLAHIRQLVAATRTFPADADIYVSILKRASVDGGFWIEAMHVVNPNPGESA